MIRLRHKLFIYGLRILDQAVLIAVLVGILELLGRLHGSEGMTHLLGQSYRPADMIGVLGLSLGWLAIFNALVAYETNRLTTLRAELLDVAKANAGAAFLLLVVGTFFSFGRITNDVVVWFWIATTALGSLSRWSTRWFLVVVRRSGYNYRHLLIVGHNEKAHQLAARVEALPELGYKIVGFVAESSSASTAAPSPDGRVIGALTDLKSILEQRTVDEMMICLADDRDLPDILQTIKLAKELGIVARIFPAPDLAKIATRFHVERFDGEPVITLFREQMLLQLLGKRVLDFIGSFVLLVVLSPLLIAVAIAIKLTSPGPIMFVQRRVGMNKRTFNLYKFRSMYIDAEKRRRELEHLNEMDGPVFKIKNDPRITPLGGFIRKTSIDELPQLLNVLVGQMSLVGPRPPIPEEVDRYEWLYRKRLSIKPGITCLWQISGRNHISFKQWMELDQQYIDSWSLWVDLKILLKTVPAVLFRTGAS